MNKKRVISFITMTSILLSSVAPASAFAKAFNNKTNIALDHAWTVTVSKPLATVQDFNKIKITDNSTGANIPIACSVTGTSNTTLSITPQQQYKPNSSYTLTVDGLKDTTGDNLSDNATLSFTTIDNSNFQLQSFDNIFDTASVTESNVDTNKTLVGVFTKPIDASTLSSIYITDSNGNKPNITPQLSQSGTTLTILPNNDFWDSTHTVSVPRDAYSCDTTYTVHLEGLKSTDGQPIVTANANPKFKTVDYPQTINPTLDGIKYGGTIDYLANVTKYLSDTIDPVASGKQATSLWPQHEDSTGSTIFESSYGHVPEQLVTSWNTYANTQAKNLFNLQVALRKQNSMLAGADANYASLSPGFRQGTSIAVYNMQGYTKYAYETLLSDYFSTTFTVYLNYSEDSNCYQDGILTDSNITNAIKTLKPQIILTGSASDSTNKLRTNSSQLAVYQTLYALLGKSYANDVFNFFNHQKNGIITMGNLSIEAVKGVVLIRFN